MNTAETLREELAITFANLKAGTITHQEASALANLAGKVISSAMGQVKYYAARDEPPRIAFLDSTKGAEIVKRKNDRLPK